MAIFKSRSNLGSTKISQLDWPRLANIDEKEKDEQLKLLVGFKEEYVLPQLMAFLSSTNFKLEKNDDGLYNFSESLSNWGKAASNGDMFYEDGTAVTKEDLVGMFSMLRVQPRSVILPDKISQISEKGIRFCHAVPLFLSAFKQYRNILYKSWDLTDRKLKVVTDPKNLEVLQMEPFEVPWTSEQLLKVRDDSRTYKSGSKAGEMRTLNQTYSISATEDIVFNSLPPNAKLILCQTWVYQPNLQHEYGLYNLDNPDAKSTPLVDVDISANKKIVRDRTDYEF